MSRIRIRCLGMVVLPYASQWLGLYRKYDSLIQTSSRDSGPNASPMTRHGSIGIWVTRCSTIIIIHQCDVLDPLVPCACALCLSVPVPVCALCLCLSVPCAC